MKKLAVATLLGVALLTACGAEEPPVKSGTIVSRDHSPALDTTVMMPMYGTRCSGNPMQCSQYIISWYPVTEHTPECWGLKLRSDDGRTGAICIPEGTWRNTRVGERYGQ